MIGTIINNRYRVEDELGQGGMSVVYQGYDILLERDIAIKLLSMRSISAQSRARLLVEARSAARLNHPNIVSVYDAGEFQTAEGEIYPYVIMELLEGTSLRNYRPLNLDGVIQVALQVCAALDHAHNHDIIHRDLKPENILITREGVTKLIDFGLAQSVTADFKTGEALVGTLYYISPEAILSREVDGRADLYALGIILYEMCAGILPFNSQEPLEVIAQHLHNSPRLLADIRPDLPSALVALIHKLIEKDPNQRYANAGEVAKALSGINRDRLQKAEKGPRHNLPAQLTSFVGRERELQEIKRLLLAKRMVTLTGVGGTGKTRLALKAAEEQLPYFTDGVWLVELAAIFDPGMVERAIIKALGIQENGSKPAQDILIDRLSAKQVLLILDNCEHLIQVCAQTSETLLQACPRIKVLATSREALGIPGETIFHVPSLSIPKVKTMVDLETLKSFEAVRLFDERALVVNPHFSLTEDNASYVTQICSRLDGIPMAIELAAAKTRILSLEQIAARLNDRFRLLTGGSRSALPRQQTLQATIDWSYDLLTDKERLLLCRLSVFSGSWNLEYAEEICSGESCQARIEIKKEEILELIQHLVDKSLVIPDASRTEIRFRLLETIRQYARKHLFQAGEGEWVRDRHVALYLRLSQAARLELWRGQQVEWLNRLEQELDNFRAALEWCQEVEQETSAVADGLLIASNLFNFWMVRGYWSEGLETLTRLINLCGLQDHPVERARALPIAGLLSYHLGWRGDAKQQFEQGLVLAREINEKIGEAYALYGLGLFLTEEGDSLRAQDTLEKSMALAQQMHDDALVIMCLSSLGMLKRYQNKFEEARDYYEKNLAMCRAVGHQLGAAGTLLALAVMDIRYLQAQRAKAAAEESLAIFQAAEDKSGQGNALMTLGWIWTHLTNPARARQYMEEGLKINRELGNTPGIASALNSLGEVARLQGDYNAANDYYQESLSLYQKLDRIYGGSALHNLGYVALFRGDYPTARECFWRATQLAAEKENRILRLLCLAGMACLISVEGCCELEQQLVSAHLFGAYEASLVKENFFPDPPDQAEIDRNLKYLQARLDPAQFKLAWESGMALTLDQALVLAFEPDPVKTKRLFRELAEG